MMNKVRNLALLLIVGFVLSLTACNKYRKYDNGAVVEDTFSGDIDVTTIGDDPTGIFEGQADNGVYSFAWENFASYAELYFDLTPTDDSVGLVEFIIRDARGNTVIQEELNAELPGDSLFFGQTELGEPGKWLIEMNFTDFSGEGSYYVLPSYEKE
jgi:hypothetical protein